MNEIINQLSDKGPVVTVLIALSILAVTLIVMKALQLSSLLWFNRRHFAKALNHWQQQDSAVALDLLQAASHPVDRVLLVAMRGYNEARTDAAMLREEITRLATRELNRLAYLLRPLELIASISPLLGLLGTVLGMIEAFQQLESAGNQVNPALLSGGIWQALLTTALGLIIAIPVVIAHSFFERQMEWIRQQMEDAVTQVFTRDLVAIQSAAAETVQDDTRVLLETADHAV